MGWNEEYENDHGMEWVLKRKRHVVVKGMMKIRGKNKNVECVTNES